MLYIIFAAALFALGISDTIRSPSEAHPPAPCEPARTKRHTQRRPGRQAPYRNPYTLQPYRPTTATDPEYTQRRRPGHPIATRGPRPDLYRRQ